jgi:hypothetical protein
VVDATLLTTRSRIYVSIIDDKGAETVFEALTTSPKTTTDSAATGSGDLVDAGVSAGASDSGGAADSTGADTGAGADNGYLAYLSGQAIPEGMYTVSVYVETATGLVLAQSESYKR